MNDKQLDIVLEYLNEGTEIDTVEFLYESIQEEINRLSIHEINISFKINIFDLIKKLINIIKEILKKIVNFLKSKIFKINQNIKNIVNFEIYFNDFIDNNINEAYDPSKINDIKGIKFRNDKATSSREIAINNKIRKVMQYKSIMIFAEYENCINLSELNSVIDKFNKLISMSDNNEIEEFSTEINDNTLKNIFFKSNKKLFTIEEYLKIIKEDTIKEYRNVTMNSKEFFNFIYHRIKLNEKFIKELEKSLKNLQKFYDSLFNKVTSNNSKDREIINDDKYRFIIKFSYEIINYVSTYFNQVVQSTGELKVVENILKTFSNNFNSDGIFGKYEHLNYK